jgi:hypothetical protein
MLDAITKLFKVIHHLKIIKYMEMHLLKLINLNKHQLPMKKLTKKNQIINLSSEIWEDLMH